MKKYISIILALAMTFSLCACAAQTAAEPSPEPTPEPTPIPTPTPTPEPEWEPGTVRVGPVVVVHSVMNRGDELSAVGQWGDYYIVSAGDYELLVEAQFLRLADEADFEAREAYAESKTEVFSSAVLQGEPVETLSMNTKLQVLDGKGDWLYVEWEEGSGYISADNANDHPRVYYYGGGGGSGGSGGSGGGGGADGGDIQLTGFSQEKLAFSLLSAYVGPEYNSFTACQAAVLSDETELYYCILDYGETVRVTAAGEESCTLFIGSELLADVPRSVIFMDGDEKYEPWTGYTKSKSLIYEDYQMRRLLAEAAMNDVVEVLDRIGDTCVVSFNGQIGYVNFESLSEKQIAYYYYDGGGSGGGGGAEWSAPVL